MRACRSAGIGGRPRRDFHRQNRRNPWRCQRSNVAGCTMTNAWRQSNQRASQVRAMRMAFVACCGFTCRSWYRASCLRRNRFSAARAVGERRHSRRKWSASTRSIRNVEAACVKEKMRDDSVRIGKVPFHNRGYHSCILSHLGRMASSIVRREFLRTTAGKPRHVSTHVHRQLGLDHDVGHLRPSPGELERGHTFACVPASACSVESRMVCGPIVVRSWTS